MAAAVPSEIISHNIMKHMPTVASSAMTFVLICCAGLVPRGMRSPGFGAI